MFETRELLVKGQICVHESPAIEIVWWWLCASKGEGYLGGSQAIVVPP
jgi:hypothetical protein